MTKQDILEYFKDINAMYNEYTRYDNLSRMLDELQEPCEDCISRDAVEDAIAGEIAAYKEKEDKDDRNRESRTGD